MPVDVDGAWPHNIAGEAYVVASACFEAFAAERELAVATVRNRVEGDDGRASIRRSRRRAGSTAPTCSRPSSARSRSSSTVRVRDGERLVRACYMAAVYAPADAIDEAEQAVRAIYHGQGWRVNAERYVQLPSWLACLPMVPAGGLDADLARMGRMKTLLTSSAVNLAPVHGEWRGQPATRPPPRSRPASPLLGVTVSRGSAAGRIRVRITTGSTKKQGLEVGHDL